MRSHSAHVSTEEESWGREDSLTEADDNSHLLDRLVLSLDPHCRLQPSTACVYLLVESQSPFSFLTRLTFGSPGPVSHGLLAIPHCWHYLVRLGSRTHFGQRRQSRCGIVVIPTVNIVYYYFCKQAPSTLRAAQSWADVMKETREKESIVRESQRQRSEVIQQSKSSTWQASQAGKVTSIRI